MKILVCDPIDLQSIARMRAAGIQVDLRDDITAEELTKVIAGYEGIVVRSRTKVRAPLIKIATNLKIIVRGGVGLDNIDADFAQSEGITIINTPGASSASVAELTLGYMFALARHISQTTASMKAGKWEKNKFEGSELSEKTLGIIGLGRIGMEVAWRAKALGMHVIAFDPYVTPTRDEELHSLDKLLKISDYITLHLPPTPETQYMIGANEFAKMKDGVRIMNCARGGIIDENALYQAILSGKVAGAALDVYEQEPPEDNKLLKLDQVIGSPHIGASTKEAQARVGAEIADKIIAYYKKHYPQKPEKSGFPRSQE